MFSRLYYGQFLPNSLEAKASASGFWQYYIASGEYYFSQLTHFLSPWLRVSWIRPLSSLIAMILYAGGVLILTRYRIEGALLLIWPILLRSAYALIGAPLYHWWEIYAIVPFTALTIWVALFWVIEKSLIALNSRKNPLRQMVRREHLPSRRVVFGVILVLCIVPKPFESIRTSKESSITRYTGNRTRFYLEVADILRRMTAPDSTVLMHEIGLTGYYSDRKIIDAAGLVTPGVYYHGSSGHKTSLTSVIEQYSPDYLLIQNSRNHVSLYDTLKIIIGNYSTFMLAGKKGLPIRANQMDELDVIRQEVYQELTSDTLFHRLHLHAFLLMTVVVFIGCFGLVNLQNCKRNKTVFIRIDQWSKVRLILLLIVALMLLPQFTLSDHAHRQKQVLVQAKKPATCPGVSGLILN